MEKIFLKLYDKLIIAVIFSAIFLISCEEPEPTPMYGIVPMYGVPTNVVDNNQK